MELITTVYNINPDNNTNIRAKSFVLDGYCIFIEKVRLYTKELELEAALDQAIEECIKENVLADFFKQHGNEVKHVTKLDFSYERQLEFAKDESFKDGFNDGFGDGYDKGIIFSVEAFLRSGETPELIASTLKLDLEKVLKIKENMN